MRRPSPSGVKADRSDARRAERTAGGRPLEAGAEPVVLQAKDAIADESWRTVDVPPGAWALPRSSGRFFRAVFKW